MLNRNLIVFFVLLVFFGAYFLRDGFIEPDSYYFFNFVCGVTFEEKAFPVTSFFLNLFPCSVFFVKLFLFGVALTSLLVLKKAGELISSEYGFLAPVFFIASPVFFVFMKFEDDQFSLPFIFFSVYYCLKYHKQKRQMDLFKSIGAAVVGFVLWPGSVYLLLSSLLFRPFVFAVPFILFFFPQIVSNLIPSFVVYEDFPLIGLVTPFFLVLGYFSVKLFFSQTVFFSVVAGLKAKFSPFLSIFLSILMVDVFGRLPKVKQVAFLFFIAILLFSNLVSVFSLPLNESDFLAARKAYRLSKVEKLEFAPELIYGYYLNSIGIDENSNPGNYDAKYVFEKNAIILTRFSPETMHGFNTSCVLVEQVEKNFIFRC